MDADPVIFPHGETVLVLTAGSVTDPYSGEPSESWDTPTAVEVPGVAVEPRPIGTQGGGELLQDARNSVTSGFTLYMPVDTLVDAKSRVIVRGETYNVKGEPAAWRSPFTGWEPGIVVQVGREEG